METKRGAHFRARHLRIATAHGGGGGIGIGGGAAIGSGGERRRGAHDAARRRDGAAHAAAANLGDELAPARTRHHARPPAPCAEQRGGERRRTRSPRRFA